MRQEEIIEIIKKSGPISGEQIAAHFKLTRAALRPHLAVLTTAGVIKARPRVGYSFTGKELCSFPEEKLSSIKVKDVKGIPVVVREDISAYDAVVSLFTNDVGTLFVVSQEGFLKGVVSRKDFLKSFPGSADACKIPVNVIMTRMPHVHTAMEEENILVAAKRIIECEVDSLPVVRPVGRGENLKVVGRITKTNMVRFLVELGEGW